MKMTRVVTISMVTALASVAACGSRGTTSGASTGWDAGSGGADAGAGTGGADGGGAGGNTGCAGMCVAGPAVGWTFPYYVWIGKDASAAPNCWPGAPVFAYE